MSHTRLWTPPPTSPTGVKVSILRFIRRSHLTNFLFILPAVSVYLLYVAWPIFRLLYDSVFKWDGWIEETRIGVGLENYIELLTNDKCSLPLSKTI